MHTCYTYIDYFPDTELSICHEEKYTFLLKIYTFLYKVYISIFEEVLYIPLDMTLSNLYSYIRMDVNNKQAASQELWS